MLEQCEPLLPLRNWVGVALDRVTGWTMPRATTAVFMAYGRRDGTPADNAIRGTALDTIRQVRSARISQEHRMAEATAAGEPVERRMRLPTERELTEALGARLDLAIMADWQAAMMTRSTRHKLTDATGTLRRRPRDVAAFIRRWGSVCEIARGRCTPRSRWIDQQGPALTLDVGD
jgi:hypothetical protein